MRSVRQHRLEAETHPGRAVATLSLEEIIARYEGQWILMSITEFDDRHVPARGAVLVHSPSRAAVSRKLVDVFPGASGSSAKYYLFQAHPFARTGPELRQALHDAWQAEERGVRPGR